MEQWEVGVMENWIDEKKEGVIRYSHLLFSNY